MLGSLPAMIVAASLSGMWAAPPEGARGALMAAPGPMGMVGARALRPGPGGGAGPGWQRREMLAQQGGGPAGRGPRGPGGPGRPGVGPDERAPAPGPAPGGGPGDPGGPGGRGFGARPPRDWMAPALEKAAYLGVASAPVPRALGAQLDLPAGIGLVVEFVDPDGPAKAAGIQPHDVLHKFDDQLLVSPQQLAVLVRSRKAGEQVTLTVIRQARPTTLTATLAEQEQPVLGVPPAPSIMPPRPGLRPGLAPGLGPWGGRLDPSAGSQTSAVFQRGERRLTLTPRDGRQTFRLEDAQGNLLAEGEAQSEQDRGKLPLNAQRWLELLMGDAGAPATQPAAR